MIVADPGLAMRLRTENVPLRRKRARLLGGVLLVGGLTFAAGCSVIGSRDYPEGEEGTRNRCEESCSVGICVDGICEARAGTLKKLLVEVSLPSGTMLIPGVNFTSEFTITDTAADIRVDNVSKLSGGLTGASIAPASCIPLSPEQSLSTDPAGSFAARVTLLPRTRLLGLSSSAATAETILEGEGYAFSLTAPPGYYDVFVEPSGSDVNCFRPPFLVVNQKLAPGNITLKQTLPEPVPLDVSVEFAQTTVDLSNFELAIVEGATGRVISNVVKLGKKATSDGIDYYSKRLVYSTVQGSLAMPVPELLRLRPPEGTLAPTIFVERAVAEIFQNNKAVLHQLLSLPKPITVSGKLAAAGSESKRAKLLFVATELDFVTAGTPFVFEREVETTDAGAYSVELLPGKYKILLQPESSSFGLATFEETLVVDRGDLELAMAAPLTLTGSAYTPFNEVYPFLDFELVEQQSAFSGNFRGERAPIVRAVESFTDSGGLFTTSLDPGTYTMTFRPSEASGYPWAIIPTVRMQSGGSSQIFAPISLPISLKGTVLAADVGVAASAVVRFYALLEGDKVTDDLSLATRAIPIAEARADEFGAYSVLLPSRLGN